MALHASIFRWVGRAREVMNLPKNKESYILGGIKQYGQNATEEALFFFMISIWKNVELI